MSNSYKYFLFLQIFVCYAIFSYNRKSVSLCNIELLKDGLKKEQIGSILSLQNLAYAISKFLGGVLSDKISPKNLFLVGLSISGTTAVLFSHVDDFILYSILWFINGLAQGVSWPAVAKLLAAWFEPYEIGTWWSLASASANLIGCFAPFLARYIIDGYGWRTSVHFAGLIAYTAVALSYGFIQDEPESASNKRKIDSSKDNTNGKKTKQNESAFKILLNSPAIWIISFCYLVTSSIKTSLTDWSTVYLVEERQLSMRIANSFLSSVELGGMVGGVLAGYMTDYYVKKKAKANFKNGSPRMNVAIILAVPLTLAMNIFCTYISAETSLGVMSTLGVLIGASVYGQIAVYGIVATQSVVPDMSGSSHAIAALAANVGSIVAGLPFATIAKFFSWNQVFTMLHISNLAVILVICYSYRVSFKIGQKPITRTN